MGLFRRRRPRHARHAVKTTRAERRAAERTAQAEATLAQTEQRVYEPADEVRSQVNPSAPQ
jgi:hypothetical protein